jgi:hypothetical protein
MSQTIQFLLAFESAAFVVAALVHFGFLANGYEHTKAGIAETVIGTVLALGLIIVLIRPRLRGSSDLSFKVSLFSAPWLERLRLSSELDRALYPMPFATLPS